MLCAPWLWTASSPSLNDALTTLTKQKAGTSSTSKPSLCARAQPSSCVPGDGAGSTPTERKPVHPTNSRASGAEGRGGVWEKPTLGAGRQPGCFYLYHRVLQLSVLQLRNPPMSTGKGQKSALSVSPGTYCWCSRGARRLGAGGGGDIPEAAVLAQGDTLG